MKSLGAAEILAAEEPIDEAKILATANSALLGINVGLLVALDSKDLFETLSTCRNSVDCSIHSDENVIRYEFETYKVHRVIWIFGKVNLADLVTKPNSALVEPLQLSMFTGKLSLFFDESLSRSSVQSTGYNGQKKKDKYENCC